MTKMKLEAPDALVAHGELSLPVGARRFIFCKRLANSQARPVLLVGFYLVFGPCDGKHRFAQLHVARRDSFLPVWIISIGLQEFRSEIEGATIGIESLPILARNHEHIAASVFAQ